MTSNRYKSVCTWNSVPIEQFVIRDVIKQHDIASLYSQAHGSPVKLFKERLGKQLYTLNGGEYRFWVWEGRCQDWRVFVSNKKGVCLEVAEKSSIASVKLAWDDFTEHFGLDRVSSTIDFKSTKDGINRSLARWDGDDNDA